MKLWNCLLIVLFALILVPQGHAGYFETAAGQRLRAHEIIAARRLLVGCSRYLDRQVVGREDEILDFARSLFLHGWMIEKERGRELIWWRKALAGSASVVRAALPPADVRIIGSGLTELAFFYRPDSFGPDGKKRRRALEALRRIAGRLRRHLASLVHRPVFRRSPIGGDEDAPWNRPDRTQGVEPGFLDLGKDDVPSWDDSDAPPTAAKPTSEPPAAPAQDLTHRVVWGDTLSEIIVDAFAKAGIRSDIPLYGPGSLVDQVAAANGIEDPNLIYPGQSISIPAALLGREESIVDDEDHPAGQDVDLVFAL